MRVVKTRLWPPIARSAVAPAAWFFALVWVAAVAMLVVRGHTDRAEGAPVILVPLLFFCWLTALLTDDPPEAELPPGTRPRVWMQVAAVIAIAAGIEVAVFAGALPFGIPAWIGVPVLELVIPLVVLLVLGARLRELGFGPGHHVGRVLLLWCAPQLFNVLISGGGAHPLQLLLHFLRNGLQNGPIEEFLFRGALQTRLTLLLGAGWGLVLSAVTFGLWHTGANVRTETHGDVISAACVGVISQAPFGLAFGLILLRTRNLLAGSVFHMLVDLP
jgi:membrane protease YdiL (CAAX protease family)